MRIRAMTPSEIVVDAEVLKVIAEGPRGSFCLLPRHQDLVALLVPGLLSFVSPENRETFLATDEGLLVKTGAEVRVTSWKIVLAGNLGAVRDALRRYLEERSGREHQARLALARLEAEFVHRLGALQRSSGV
jgi:F-type H+-transporting ATPase subunit epsilon